MSLIRRLLRKADQAIDGTPAESRGVSWWERNRKALEAGSTLIQAIGVLVAGSLAVNEYLDNSLAERVNVTLKYVDRFQTERVVEARRTLEQAWNARSKEVSEILAGADGETRLAAYLEEAIAQLQLSEPIGTILDFYDELEACTVAALCDRETAVRFFGKYAWDFRGLLAPHIERERQELRDELIGSGVDYFSLQYQRMRETNGKGKAKAATD